MYVKVRVETRAKNEAFIQKSDDHFDIQVRERAERNMANTRVIELIARHFAVPVAKVRIVNGHQSPSKLLSVDVPL